MILKIRFKKRKIAKQIFKFLEDKLIKSDDGEIYI